MSIIGALYFLFIGVFSRKFKIPALIISLAFSLFPIVDHIFLNFFVYDYQSSIYLATTFDALTAFLLTFILLNRFTGSQIVLLLCACTVHTIQLIDIIAETNFVFDHYEVYIVIISIAQMVVAYDGFKNALVNSIESFRAVSDVLLRRYVYCRGSMQGFNESAGGKSIQ